VTVRERKIFWIIVFNLLIIFSEVLFGWIGNSFALIADALHNAGDVLAVGITYLALRLASVQPSFRRTFGYARAEMMAGFVNTLFLVLTMFYLMIEAIGRLGHPEVVDPFYMMTVGLIAMIANGISAYILHGLGVSHCAQGEEHEDHHHHHGHEDTNIRSAYLHMLSDALISAGVIVAGVFIYFFEIHSIDAILTLVFSIYILAHTYPLLKTSFLSLMDINTIGVTEEAIDRIITEHEEVVEYHDLHLHAPSSQERFISFHLVFRDDAKPLRFFEHITDAIRHQLEHAGFSHILIQTDSQRYVANHHYCTGGHHVSV
jgi:cobalt-zinc-cadmium efflux system protein